MIYNFIYIAEIAAGVAAGIGICIVFNMLIDKYWRW